MAGLDLVFNPAVVVRFAGANGAGKTTFVAAGATLLRPDAGTCTSTVSTALRKPAK